MTAININNAKTYLDIHGASRRVKVSAASPELTLDDSMLPVILRVSKMRSGLEFYLHNPSQFHVFMHGDYMGGFRKFEDKFVISSRNIKRERSAYGLNGNEEASSSERNITMKMADKWSGLTYGAIRGLGTYFCNRVYSATSPNFTNNKPSTDKIYEGITKWAATFTNCDYMMPDIYGNHNQDMTTLLYNILYHLFLDTLPAKQDLDWDEEPTSPSRIYDITASMPDADKHKFIELMDEMNRRVMRKQDIFNTGGFLRVNREGKINVISRLGLGEDANAVTPRYDSVDALLAPAPDLKTDFVYGVNSMVGAGKFRYVDGVGMRLTDLPEEIMASIDSTILAGYTMYWVEAKFLKPLTASISI